MFRVSPLFVCVSRQTERRQVSCVCLLRCRERPNRLPRGDSRWLICLRARVLPRAAPGCCLFVCMLARSLRSSGVRTPKQNPKSLACCVGPCRSCSPATRQHQPANPPTTTPLHACIRACRHADMHACMYGFARRHRVSLSLPSVGLGRCSSTFNRHRGRGDTPQPLLLLSPAAAAAGLL